MVLPLKNYIETPSLRSVCDVPFVSERRLPAELVHNQFQVVEIEMTQADIFLKVCAARGSICLLISLVKSDNQIGTGSLPEKLKTVIRLKDTPNNWLLVVLFLIENCAKIHGDTFHDSSEGFFLAV